MRRLLLTGTISLFLSFNPRHAAGKSKDKEAKPSEAETTQNDENTGPDSPPSPSWYEQIPVPESEERKASGLHLMV